MIRNLPVTGALDRVIVVCQQDRQTLYGVSNYFLPVRNRTYVVEAIRLSATPPPAVVTLQARPARPVLTRLREQTQITVTALLSDNTRKNVSAQRDGTSYRTSNGRIATVGQDGLVTALSNGQVFLTATNEGATATTSLTVSLGDPGTTVIGFVELPDGTAVVGADVTILGQTTTAKTNRDGRFTIRSQLSLQGPLVASVRATINSKARAGASGPIDPDPGGISDAGRILLGGTGRGLVAQRLRSGCPSGPANLSVVDALTLSVESSLAVVDDLLDVAVTDDGALGLCTSRCRKKVLLYDLASTPPKPVGSIGVPTFPWSLVLTPSSSYALTHDFGSNGGDTVASIELAHRRVVSTLRTRQRITALAIHPDEHLVLAGTMANRLHILELWPNGVLTDSGKTVSIGGSRVMNVEFSPDGKQALVTGGQNVDVLTVDRGVVSLRKTVRLREFTGLNSIIYHPTGRKAYMLMELGGSSRLGILSIDAAGDVNDSGRRIGPWPSGNYTFQGLDRIALSTAGSKLLVHGLGRVVVIDTAQDRVVGTISLQGSDPMHPGIAAIGR